MSLFNYYATLRAEVLKILAGVEDAEDSLIFDRTASNCETKNRLKKMLIKHLADAREFGLLVVTRHCDCPNPMHSGYHLSNAYGLKIEYLEKGYVWNGGQFYQGNSICVCPCSPENSETGHHIIEDIIYEDNANVEACEKIGAILRQIYASVVCAKDKKPRSGIREHLLKTVLKINDEVLPEPIDTYISRRLAEEA